MALATRAAKTASRRYPKVDIDDLTMDLVEAALSKAPTREALPRVGDIGTDPRIEAPIERDRAYLIGVATHRLADYARSEAAEVDSLDAKVECKGGDLPTTTGLTEQGHTQARTDPNLVNPDAQPINRDVWAVVDAFPTKDAGRAALANLIGGSATRAQLAQQAGLGDAKDWHRSVKRGRTQLASLAKPRDQWTPKDRATEAVAKALVATIGPDNPKSGINQLLTQPPSRGESNRNTTTQEPSAVAVGA